MWSALTRGRSGRQWVEAYEQGHTNPVNRACHAFGIPMITASIPLFLAAYLLGRFWRIPLTLFTVGWGFQLLGHAFAVAHALVLLIQHPVPGTVRMVDEVVPAVGPEAVVPTPEAAFSGAQGQQCSGGNGLGLRPEVLHRAGDLQTTRHGLVGHEHMGQAAIGRVPGRRPAPIPRCANARDWRRRCKARTTRSGKALRRASGR